MQNITAFVNAVIPIVISVLSAVCSLPNQQVELNGVPSTIGPLSTCFDSYPYPHNKEIRSIHERAVDSKGRSCFQTHTESFMQRLLDKTHFENNYANVTEQVCPNWSHSKQCLWSHLNSSKCTEDDRQSVMNSEIVNTQIVISDLLCNPVRALYFRNLWEKTLNEGLWDCVFGEEIHELYEECEGKKMDEKGNQAHYQDLGLYFDCMRPGLTTCAHGDNAKEVKLAQLWEEFDGALQQTHRAFWNY